MDDRDAGNTHAADAGQRLFGRRSTTGKDEQGNQDATHPGTLPLRGKPFVHARFPFAGGRRRRYGPPLPPGKGCSELAREFVVDIFEEVAEELRAEKMRKLAMRYGGLLVAVAIGIVAAAGGWQAWRWRQAKQDAAAAGDYITAMAAAEGTSSASSAGRAIAIFDRLSATAPDGYRILARLSVAGMKATAGDRAGASASWDQVAADPAADPVLRELATLVWAQHQIDEGDPAVVSSRLLSLNEPRMPWHSLVEEQLALLDLRQDKNEAAKAALRKLEGDSTAPAGVRGRSSSLISKLGE